MTILDRIIIDQIKEIDLRKKAFPIGYWENSPFFKRECISLSQRLQDSPSGIIAEHKRRSPSQENINTSLSVHQVAKGYENAGACGISVLTNQKYFGGVLRI